MDKTNCNKIEYTTRSKTKKLYIAKVPSSLKEIARNIGVNNR